MLMCPGRTRLGKARFVASRSACASIAASVTAVVVSAALVGCGGGGHDSRTVVRVGDGAITAADVAHWMAVLAPGHVVPDRPRYTVCIAREAKLGNQAAGGDPRLECQRRYQELEQQALGYLLSTTWLLGEAAELGAKVSSEDARRQVERRIKSSPNGQREYEESLKATDYTVGDSELEAQAEIARARIRRQLIRNEPAVSSAEIARYYRQNIRRYQIPERRYFYIVENLKSEAAAQNAIREIGRGKSIASMSLYESLPRKSFASVPGLKRIIYEAIFAAKLNVLAGPVTLNHLRFLFKVTRITPFRLPTLAEVGGAIKQKLTADRNRRTLAQFAKAWRRKWIARTSCIRGYVTDQCRQYDRRGAEEPLSAAEQRWAPG